MFDKALRYFPLIIGSVLLSYSQCCSIGLHNLTALDGVSWTAHAKEGNKTILYVIGVCDTLKKLKFNSACPEDAAVCKLDTGADSTSVTDLGNRATDPSDEELPDEGVLRRVWQGSYCPNPRLQNNHRTTVTFKCGKTLGSPIFISSEDCDTYFEWYTTVACKTPPTALKEVKCYVHDDQGQKFDLSPLIKQTGAYNVTNDLNIDLSINVCRDITDSSTCVAGSGACAKGDAGGTDLGHPMAPLALDDSGTLTLHYVTETKGDSFPDGCTDSYATTITFRCPDRGVKKAPQLISGVNCHYDILWETEFACHEDYLTSTTCKMNAEQHGVKFDLTPLKNAAKYVANGTENADTYSYLISICQPLVVPCNYAEDVAVCQVKYGDSASKVLGKSDHMTLRYSDGDLSLTYASGDMCHTSNFCRTTIINFHCNPTAGPGSPVFSVNDDCSYIFDWETSFACLEDHTVSCSVKDGDKVFDLSSLTRVGRDYWIADDLVVDTNGGIVLNVCNPLSHIGIPAMCEEGTGICMKVENGWRSLGKPSGAPVYHSDRKSVELLYKGGSPCSQDTYSASIQLMCKPGDIESRPLLIFIDQCRYKFEWHTAGACVQAEAVGQDCRMFDAQNGLQFDLSPLMNTSTSGPAYYKYHHEVTDVDFYLNVCGAATSAPCSGQVGMCQVDSTGSAKDGGKPNGQLHYYNGILRLNYTGGDPYNDAQHSPRSTSIVFICDVTAGAGRLEFEDETDHTYTFRWVTKYACPELPVECAAVSQDGLTEFDLTKLMHLNDTENWFALDPDTDRKFYINLCHSLTPLEGAIHCDPMAAICATQDTGGTEVATVANIGQSLSRPVIVGTSPGELSLSYTMGDPCEAASGQLYSARLELHCVPGAPAQSPRFLYQDGCVFVFEWMTGYACPVEKAGPGTGSPLTAVCAVRDPYDGYDLDLKQLSKEDYTVTHGDDVYKIAVCGAVKGCGLLGGKDPGACLGNTTIGTVNTRLAYAEDGSLYLSYEGGRTHDYQIQKVVITFKCNRSIPLGELRFDSQEQDVLYRFTLMTSLACPPQPVECLATDTQGNAYDLSGLSKEVGNWEVEDTRSTHSDLRYYINVCRPINAIDNVTCSGGAVGGCQVSSAGASVSTYSMGYVQSAPIAAADGTITLHYMTGDVCHQGRAGESRRSTRILFYCSPVEGFPAFEEETPGCEYVISWRTPHACPVKKAVGSGCTVTDSLYGWTFDVSPLTRADGDYSVAAGEYTYLINVCAALQTGTGDCAGAGVCQTKSAVGINAGMANDHLTYDDGELTLVYGQGKGQCHGTFTRRTIVTFVCNHTASGADGPRFHDESSDCTYLFTWPTRLACPPGYATQECSYRDDATGQWYDLSGLTQADRNYEYGDSSRVTYVLNVCAVIVHGKGVTCRSGSAACAIRLDEADPTKKYFDIGQITDMTIGKEGEHLLLTYINGQDCEAGGASSTSIQLVCDPDKVDTQPRLLYTEGCHYVFMWETSAACPVNTDVAPPTSDCKATNPATGHVYDLTSWGHPDGYALEDGRGSHTFRINICQPLAQSECGAKSGSCQVETGNADKHWNAGDANGNLVYDRGVLLLNYTNGDVCHSTLARNTVIQFVCGAPGTDVGKPVFVAETDDCTYYVSWHSELLCDDQVSCVVDLGSSVVDLSPLIKKEGSHVATTSPDADPDAEGSYYINMCRPLSPISGQLCPPNAAVCRAQVGGKAISLGSALQSPREEDGQVVIDFTDGDSCGSDKKWSSRITFVCANGPSEGTPNLEAVNHDDCMYIFSWATNVVCSHWGPAKVEESECKFEDKSRGMSFDFSPLRKGTNEDAYQVGDYYINICGSLPATDPSVAGCENSAVCRIQDNQGSSFGGTQNVFFLAERDDVKMAYQDGAQCENNAEKKASTILFRCDPNIREIKPEIFAETDCHVTFKIETALACPPVIESCVFALEGKTYDLEHLSMEEESWKLVDSDGNMYWFNLCQGVHDGPPGCGQEAAVCWSGRDSADVNTIGTVASQQVSFSDDGQAIVVEYRGMESCPGSRRRRRDSTSLVRFLLSCGNAVGKPKLVSRPSSDSDTCVFVIEWTTSVACQEKPLPVVERDGVIWDPISGRSLPILDLTDGLTKLVHHGAFTYIVELGGEPASRSAVCRGATVCEVKDADDNYHVDIGDSSNRQFFIEGGVLEAKFTSSAPCQRSSESHTATSVIDFHCWEGNNTVTEPEFIYKSRTCQYVIDWYTPAVCELTRGMGASSQPSDSTGPNPGTVGAVIGVFMAVVVLCVMAIVLHKAERRAALRNRIRGLFRRERGVHSYSYSHLQAEDPGDSLLAESRGNYGTDIGTLGNIQSYHDDSDEDILQL